VIQLRADVATMKRWLAIEALDIDVMDYGLYGSKVRNGTRRIGELVASIWRFDHVRHWHWWILACFIFIAELCWMQQGILLMKDILPKYQNKWSCGWGPNIYFELPWEEPLRLVLDVNFWWMEIAGQLVLDLPDVRSSWWADLYFGLVISGSWWITRWVIWTKSGLNRLAKESI